MGNYVRWCSCVLLLGCTGPGPEAANEPDDPGDEPMVDEPSDEPSDDTTDDVSTPVSMDELESLLQAAIARSVTFDARALELAYDDVMAESTVSCPSGDAGFWYDTCNTPEGAEYNGYAYSYGSSEAGGTSGYWTVYGEATVFDAAGHELDLGGYAGWSTYQDNSHAWAYHYAYGTFRDASPEVADTWLSGGDSVDFYAQVGIEHAGGGRVVYLDGAFGTLLGDRAQAADFDELEISSGPLLNPVCVAAPEGAVWLRTRDAVWVEVQFDCDPCGVAHRGDVELGTVCADFSPLTDWEDSPW